MKHKKRNFNWFILPAILVFAAILRLVPIMWDSGFHLHPDERMLIMVANRIDFWTNLNPDFFNYGSLPVYLLTGVSQFVDWALGWNIATYDGMLVVGRLLSTICDLLVIFTIYHLSLLIFKKKSLALWSSFFYSLAFFPIQNSHFFIVDTFLTLFVTLLIYLLLLFNKSRSKSLKFNRDDFKRIFFISITFAAALTTKITAIIFMPIILLVLVIPKKISKKTFFRLNYYSQSLISILLFAALATLFSYLFMPYAFIEYQRFISDVSQQIKMNSDPYIFPYTLQYVGTLPYFYYLKNIFIWGLGPIISILSLVGIINSVKSLKVRNLSSVLFFLFYLLYFLIIGKSSVKFMRYMLPLYPFFAIMAGYGASIITSYELRITKKRPLYNKLSIAFFSLMILSSIIWTFAFLNIYTTPNSRIQASDWIHQFIPSGSTLGVEHWDDRVPIYYGERFQYEELTLYDIPDDDLKWQVINEKLKRIDYIIIASNRLYTPLQRLDNCDETYPRCYPKTSKYYQKLFNNELSFVKIAEFTSYPRLEIGPPAGGWKLEINDLSSDESFTVYDHPEIMIYKNSNH